MQNSVLIVAGPTAVGKTSIAIHLARHLNTEIISADSRQCYKELNIGVARPSQEELSTVPHHFIASHSIHDKINAAGFEKYALAKAGDIFSMKNMVVMVGGTGLYIKAFCEGMDAIPEVPDEIHHAVVEDYNRHGLTWLQEQVRLNDPLFYQTGEVHNPQRMMRALEVILATGKSINSYKTGNKAIRNFRVVKIALELPKENLHANINTRVDLMIKSGLEEEVRALIPYQHLNALQTVGYKEIFDHFNGIHTMNEAIGLIKKNTRQYAKRQMTWFRKDKDYNWFPPNADLILQWLNDKRFTGADAPAGI